MRRGNAVIAQMGGPTAVINETLAGIARELRGNADFRGSVYGSTNGIDGLLNWDVISYDSLTDLQWQKIRKTPGNWQGNSRKKTDGRKRKKILKNLADNDVDHVFMIGGNGTATVAMEYSELSKRLGYDIQFVHVSKTVDNDMALYHHTPGFPSAAAHVVRKTAELIVDGINGKPTIIYLETMGRDAGHLAAAASQVNRVIHDGNFRPAIFIPEQPTTLSYIVEHAVQNLRDYGIGVVVVSEGLRDSRGRLYKGFLGGTREDDQGRVVSSSGDSLLTKLEQMTKNRYAKRIITQRLGYPQRSDPQRLERDAMEAYDLGVHAALHALHDPSSHFSVGIQALRSGPYSARYEQALLDKIGGKHSPLPRKMQGDWVGYPNVAELKKYHDALLGELQPSIAINHQLLKNRI